MAWSVEAGVVVQRAEESVLVDGGDFDRRAVLREEFLGGEGLLYRLDTLRCRSKSVEGRWCLCAGVLQDGRPLGSEKADEDVLVGPWSDEEGR